MSVVNILKGPAVDADMLREYFLSGKKITRVKSRRKMPKHLRYNSYTANCKNHSPKFNPMKHAV